MEHSGSLDTHLVGRTGSNLIDVSLGARLGSQILQGVARKRHAVSGYQAQRIFADRFARKTVMALFYLVLALTIPLLLLRHREPAVLGFAILFGFAMGADYMLIPLMAAEQFGVNSLARAMAVILPVNTIGQTWFPYFVSILRDRFGSYWIAMSAVLAVAVIGAVSIAILPRLRVGVGEQEPKAAPAR